MVGWFDVAGASHAFLYSDGQMTDLGTLATSGPRSSVANGINDSGQIVGYTSVMGSSAYHAFLDVNGVMTDLGAPYGRESEANGINSKQQIVGESKENPSSQHAILWDNGTATDLGSLPGFSVADADEHQRSRAYRRGIVGWSKWVNIALQATHSSTKTVKMTDLNALLPPNSGWVINTATDIDNNDEISGMGTYNGVST